MEEVAPPRPWQDVPLELAGLVLGRLPAHTDRVRFAAVCPRWRAAAREVRPLPPPLSLLMLPDDGTMYSPPLHRPFRLPAAVTGFTAACGSWLLFSGTEGGCFLRNPFSNATVLLPALHRVRKRYKQSDGSIFTYETNDTSQRISVRRLLLCSPHLVSAYVVLGPGAEISYIAVCQPGAGSWWSVCMDYSLVSEEPIVPTLAAMAFHKGTLFAVERYRGRFYAVDIGVNQTMYGFLGSDRSSLAASLLLVVYLTHMTMAMAMESWRRCSTWWNRVARYWWYVDRGNTNTNWLYPANDDSSFQPNGRSSRCSRPTCRGIGGPNWRPSGTTRYYFYLRTTVRLSVFHSLGCPGIASSSLRMLMRIAPAPGTRRRA